MLTMGYFALPKLLAKPMSVAGFQQFEKVSHIPADFFRIFTGLAELSMVVLILLFTFTQKNKLGLFAYVFLLTTMLTALGLEFFARPEPKMLLVKIAVGLSLFSVYQICYLKNKIS